MCTIILAYKKHPQYELILASNRDEFYERPSKQIHFWEENENVLGGRDLMKMGTWLGVTKEGRFSGITNYRDRAQEVKDPRSRGELVKDFLLNEQDCTDYLMKIRNIKHLYDPYNLIVGNMNNLFFYSNVTDELKELEPGIYGISNGELDADWYKIQKGKEKLNGLIENKEIIYPEDLLQILNNKLIPTDDRLPDTGVGLEWERILAPLFVESENYGTRACTVILIDKQHKVTVVEKSLNDFIWRQKKIEFKINEKSLV